MYQKLQQALLFLSTSFFAMNLTQAQTLTSGDRFEMFTQMNLHQAYIDNEGTCANSKLYTSLYWPEASFRVIDAKSGRDATFTGHHEIRTMFDYAHSVFPLYQWQHSLGAFVIDEEGSSSGDGTVKANARWKWRVDWAANTTGVVSTGYYTDVWEKRDGVWKTLQRTSRDDPNWPIEVFYPYILNEKNSFKSSCGDT